MNLGPPAETPEFALERELGRTRLPRGHDTLGDLLNSHYVILQLLADSPDEHSISGLAGLLDVDMSTASRQAKHATRLGLLSWQTSPRDARVRIVAVTELGRQHLKQAQIERRAALSEVTVDWSDDDLSRLLHLLRRFNTDAAAGPRRARARD